MDKDKKDFFLSICDKLIGKCDEIIENLKEQEVENNFTVFQSPNEIKESLENLSQPKHKKRHKLQATWVSEFEKLKEDAKRGCRDKMDEGGTNLLIRVFLNEMSMFAKPKVTYNLSDGVLTVTTEINIGNRCIKETTTHNISSEFDTNNFSVFEENGIINIVFYKK